MLVLTRRIGERISIGDNIEIVVRRVAGNRVTLGIEAPRDVRILRSELEPIVDSFEGPAAAAETPEQRAGSGEPYAIIEGHLQAIEQSCPHLKPLYRDLARMTVETARRKGSLSPSEVLEMQVLLKKHR